jgi:hypothetical protein
MGATGPDASLADYQWDVRQHPGWGAQAMVGAGRFAAGLRLWQFQTTQRIDLDDGTPSPAVRSTSVELVGDGALAEAWGMRFSAMASVGRVHLGYHPDQLTIQSAGTEVRLAPVDEWIAGGGLKVRRPVAPAWNVGLEVDHRVFGLDTAHRNGAEIEHRRETFGEWSARFELSVAAQK